jgi:C_GCAxxG_C_C family probable redox protein
MKLAAGFGGGMGGMGKTCGAVSGAIAVLGLTYEIGNPAAKASVYSLVKEFAKRFTDRHSTLICNELLGHDISTSEGIQMVREKKLFSTVCPMVDRSAAEVLEELLAEGFPFHGDNADKN